MAFGTIFSLSIYLIAMLAIGVYGYYKSTSDLSDYMLGGRRLSASVTALSAGASDMSGWMLMGLPGAFYLSGFSSVWIAIGLTIGAYVNYILVAPRLRVYTEISNDSITVPDYFENRFKDTSRTLRLVSALVIIVFFTLYTSSGFVAGGRLFESAFGHDYQTGLIVTAIVVVAYTFIGGFLAVSITDFVQGCIMFLALIIVPVTTYVTLTGDTSVTTAVNWSLSEINFDPFYGVSFIGICSLLAWGFGYFGQPHIIVRFMAIKDVKELPKAKRIGMSWMVVSLIGAMLTGIVGALYIQAHGLTLTENSYMNLDGTITDAETIFIVLSQILFHPLVTGFLLAAILAAIMSTISSQLLVTSSALVQDLYKSFLHKEASDKTLVFAGRLSVLLVALLAGSLAWNPGGTILSLVGNAWAGFGAAFGPLIVLSLYWKRMTAQGALAGMIVGALTILFWIYVPIAGVALTEYLYEIIPGVLFSSLAIIVVSQFTQAPSQVIEKEFAAMEKEIKASQ